MSKSIEKFRLFYLICLRAQVQRLLTTDYFLVERKGHEHAGGAD